MRREIQTNLKLRQLTRTKFYVLTGIETDPDIVVVQSRKARLTDPDQAEELKELIAPYLDKHIVFYLDIVKYINNRGIGMIISTTTSTRKNKRTTSLCNITEKVDSLLMTTKLGTVFPTYPTLDAAVNAIRAKRPQNPSVQYESEEEEFEE